MNTEERFTKHRDRFNQRRDQAKDIRVAASFEDAIQQDLTCLSEDDLEGVLRYGWDYMTSADRMRVKQAIAIGNSIEAHKRMMEIIDNKDKE